MVVYMKIEDRGKGTAEKQQATTLLGQWGQ